MTTLPMFIIFWILFLTALLKQTSWQSKVISFRWFHLQLTFDPSWHWITNAKGEKHLMILWLGTATSAPDEDGSTVTVYQFVTGPYLISVG